MRRTEETNGPPTQSASGFCVRGRTGRKQPVCCGGRDDVMILQTAGRVLPFESRILRRGPDLGQLQFPAGVPCVSARRTAIRSSCCCQYSGPCGAYRLGSGGGHVWFTVRAFRIPLAGRSRDRAGALKSACRRVQQLPCKLLRAAGAGASGFSLCKSRCGAMSQHVSSFGKCEVCRLAWPTCPKPTSSGTK